MRCSVIIVLALVVCRMANAVSADSVSVAAEYYFHRHDYRQALQLWNEVYRKEPQNTRALLRLAELKLLVEGRESSRDLILTHLKLKNPGLNFDSRRALKERFVQLQQMFSSDSAQSAYLQAKPKILYKDFAGAILLLNQAIALDKGNPLVLKDRAFCELGLQQFEKYRETVRSAYESNPFDPETVERLMEIETFFRNYQAVLEITKNDTDVLHSWKNRQFHAFALMETRQWNEAISFFRRVVDEKKQATPAIVFYGLGKSLSEKGDWLEALTHLERFAQSTVPTAWEPFVLAERIDEAKKLIATLKTQHTYSRSLQP